MNLNERLEALVRLGEVLLQPDDYRAAVQHRTSVHNPWFTLENQDLALHAIATHFLDAHKLREWLARYTWQEPRRPQAVGLVMAGNIPLVGFHDFLCVFVAGHQARIKLSDKDPYLFPYLLKRLAEIDTRTTAYVELVERLTAFDAVIATGSNNTARYFHAYFDSYPHIIRGNRNAVAALTGEETHDELFALGKDVFRYFGLGCRNVSKIYVPQGYDFQPLLEALHEYREMVLHTKYKNNFDYYYALYMLNRAPIWANGCIMLIENEAIPSHVGGLHYSYYAHPAELEAELQARHEAIQVVVARPNWLQLATPRVGFGQAQQPELWDYADGVDTLAFLLDLSGQSH